MQQKRVVAIHDISCLGKCSLTVALPIISAAGIETSVIPTAVLSTHTGGFGKNTFYSLADILPSISEHWREIGVSCDAVYTGYLGFGGEIDAVREIVGHLCNRNTKVIVDPVMADNGHLYRGFEPDYPKRMQRLCYMSDIITPNVTEAALLTDTEYMAPPYTNKYIDALLKNLYEKFGASVVLTGVGFSENKTGAAVFDGFNTVYKITEKANAAFHGTGDIFSSVLTAAVVRGKELCRAAGIAVDFTKDCILNTLKYEREERYGIVFETEIPLLIKYLES